MTKEHPGLLEDYLKAKNYHFELIRYYIDKFFKSATIDERRINIKDAKNCFKYIEPKEFKDEIKYWKTVLDDIEKSLVFKKELLYDNLLRQTDTSTLDIPIFEAYKQVIKQEKVGLVENKNKQYFDVNTFIN